MLVIPLSRSDCCEINWKGISTLNKKIIFIIVNIFVIISPLLTFSTVKSKSDLEDTTFGFPFPFIIQDQSFYDPPYPYEMRFQSPLENPTSINWLSLLASLLVVNVLILLFTYKRIQN